MVPARLLLALLFTLAASCDLIPQRLTECSASRPCADGQRCDAETSRCVDLEDLGTPPDSEPPPDLTMPACAGSCIECQTHADCPSLVCDDYLRSGSGGTCVPASSVVYVDNRGGACSVSGSGDTPATATCTLSEALLRIDGTQKRVIRVMPSAADYGSLVIDGKSVTIFGPAGQGGSAQIQGNGTVGALVVKGAAAVVINGLNVTRGRAGIFCQGGAASLTLRHANVTGCSDIGLLISDCALELDRVLIADNANGALGISGSQGYSVTNSFIVRNRSLALPAIKLASSVPGVFRFNTVADNTSEAAAAVECGSSRITLSDSIVFRNSRIGNSQIQSCQLRTTAVGRTDGALGIREDPSFAPAGGLDYALEASPLSNGCCIDRSASTARTDFFGILRPRGRSSDIGAHEAR